MIIEGAPFTDIEIQSKKDGIQTLQEAALEKTLDGTTSLEELIRVHSF